LTLQLNYQKWDLFKLRGSVLESHWLNGLNSEQKEAALHNYGPQLILAGAGSGKTTVLVARSGRLIEDKILTPKELCVMTFTNKAAKELKSRVKAKLGRVADGIWAGTFHSFGLHILREFYKEAGLPKTFGILDPGDATSIVKEILKDFHLGDKTAYDAEKILSISSFWRERGQTVASTVDEYEQAVEWVLPHYSKRLKQLGMIDFDGLILKPIELMEKHPEIKAKLQARFSQVMVDEFQDTNLMQMRLIDLLTDSHKNLTVVGDDDQSIYGWRGACIKNILDFPKRYQNCKVVRLEQNYRSSAAILEVANSIIAKNNERHKKVLKASGKTQENKVPQVLIFENETEEAEQIAGEIQHFKKMDVKNRDIAVLYRSNGQGPLVEAELRKMQVPYSMTGGTAFFDRKETRDILAYLKCSLKPNEIALRRILNTPARGIGDKSLEHLESLTEKKNIPFWKAALEWAEAGVDEKAGRQIENLFLILKELPNQILAYPKTPGENLCDFLVSIGYKTHLEKMAANALVAHNKWKLIEIFGRILDRYIEKGSRSVSTLSDFIDSMELRDAINEEKEDEDRVQLMTLHACKGLEFPVVFLMGVEEDILPHKTLGSDLSEERRLFYVGVTRAKEHLVLSRVQKRQRHGKLVDAAPSRFLIEIPKNLVTERIGPRTISAESRKAMLAELYKKLEGTA
jgi:DNA helicase-2/ATP-dependent DNA helicase PcrA